MIVQVTVLVFVVLSVLIRVAVAVLVIAQVVVVPAAIIVAEDVILAAVDVKDAVPDAQLDVLLLVQVDAGVMAARVTVQLLAAWTAAVVLGVVLDVVGVVKAVAIGQELPMAKINYLFSLDFAVDFHKVVTTMYPILKEEEYDGYKHCRCYY